MAERIVIRNARLAFNRLFTPEQYKGTGKPRYQAKLLVPADSQMKRDIDAAIERVAKAEWREKYAQILKANAHKHCFRDGDLKPYNGYAGNWELSAYRREADGKPAVVDRNRSPISESDGKIYSGCYVNSTVDIYVYKEENAICCSLVNVQFVKDGDAFGGAAPASADNLDDLGFEDSDDDLL